MCAGFSLMFEKKITSRIQTCLNQILGRVIADTYPIYTCVQTLTYTHTHTDTSQTKEKTIILGKTTIHVCHQRDPSR